MDQRETGRVRQKERTRRLMLASARALIEEGRSPSVAEVADHAGISRSSAYRYFSTPKMMVHEALLEAVAQGLDAVPETADPAGGTEAMVSAILRLVVRNEALFRVYLAQAVRRPDASMREHARRLDWLAQPLAPLRAQMTDGAFDRLLRGLSLLAGIETVVVLRDVCGQDDAAIEETACWVARVLVLATARDT